VFAASKHAAAWRALDPERRASTLAGQLGRDEVIAPTCATCHLSGHGRNGGAPSHDPSERLSWTHRTVLSQRRDTDEAGALVAPPAGAGYRPEVTDSWQNKRQRMRDVCLHCHGKSSVAGFWSAYDRQVSRLDELLVAPARELLSTLRNHQLLTERPLDEPIEWAWFELWHRHGRRGRLGAAMMSPEDVHGRGWVMAARSLSGSIVPRASELADSAVRRGDERAAREVRQALAPLVAGGAEPPTASESAPAEAP
jgi:hypothetical protein